MKIEHFEGNYKEKNIAAHGISQLLCVKVCTHEPYIIYQELIKINRTIAPTIKYMCISTNSKQRRNEPFTDLHTPLWSLQ